MEDELLHHGIKGMKWGVRRYQKEDGTLTDAGKKHYRNVKKRALQVGSIAAYAGSVAAMRKGKFYYDMYKMDNIFDPGSKFGRLNKRNAKIATGAAIVSAITGAALATKYNKIKQQERQKSWSSRKQTKTKPKRQFSRPRPLKVQYIDPDGSTKILTTYGSHGTDLEKKRLTNKLKKAGATNIKLM